MPDIAPRPIALDCPSAGDWFEPDEDHDPADEKIAGWLVHESYRKIVEKVGQRPRD